MFGQQRVGEVAEPLARDDVLIDRHAAQEAEADLVPRRHDGRVSGDRAAHQVAAKNGRARRRSADDTASREHFMEGLLGFGAGVRIDDVPLAAAVEPDGLGVAQILHEGFRVRHFRIVRVQHLHVLVAALDPGGNHLIFRVGPDRPVLGPVAARGRHDDDLRVRPAGELGELLHDARALG